MNRLLSDINVPQGSVATCARNGGTFNNHFTANLPKNLPVEKFCKSVLIWENYDHEFVASLFSPPYTCRPTYCANYRWMYVVNALQTFIRRLRHQSYCTASNTGIHKALFVFISEVNVTTFIYLRMNYCCNCQVSAVENLSAEKHQDWNKIVNIFYR